MISIRRLDMKYGTAGNAHHAVRDVSFEIAQGTFYTLLGPSGCGKTTTLRCIAGLERPTGGHISIDSNVVFSSSDGTWIPSSKRKIGMVFQSYAIWPHYNVFENVAFPLRRIRPKLGAGDLFDRVKRSLDLVQLSGLEERPATDLSGGQQQRLALARALVFEPRILLLDEPLSNLDAKLREGMRAEIKHLTKRLNITTVFVTHEQVEALTMSDRIAVMKNGRIVQEGTPAEIYHTPASSFVADFVGKTNLISGVVRDIRPNGGRIEGLVETPIGVLRCWSSVRLNLDQKVIVSVRPENIFAVGKEACPHDNVFSAKMGEVTFIGNLVECVIQAGAQNLKIYLHPSEASHIGEDAQFRVRVDDCLILPNHDLDLDEATSVAESQMNEQRPVPQASA